MKNIRNKHFTIGILLGLQTLAACKISKDITAPEIGLPTGYRYATADTTKITAMPWQIFFTDPELEGLITAALVHNNDLLVAVKNIGAAKLTLQQAKLGNLPMLDVEATASSSRPSDNSLDGLNLNETLQTRHIEDYTLAPSLSWEADIWGKIKSQKSAVLAAYLQTEEVRKAVQTQVVSDVSKGYYNLLMLDAQLAIAKRNVDLGDSTLNIIKLQYTAGQVTSLAVQQAQAQKLSAAVLVPEFEQQITIQENALSILIGKVPDIITRSNNLASVSFTEKLGMGMPSELLSKRPDVKLAELALMRANANVGYVKANLYPSLTITAQGGLDAFKLSNWFNIPASLFGAVAGGLTQPLFEQKKLKTQYEVAKVNRDEIVIQFRQAVLVAYGEVSDALVKLDKLKQQQALVAARTGTLQLATHNSQLLFKNGLATYLEVIIAQSNVLQSELELATIKKDRLDATVDLYRSLGGGTY
jgi:multidrug efflux system outer membrane protein